MRAWPQRPTPRRGTVVHGGTVNLTLVSGIGGTALSEAVAAESNPFEEFNKAMGAGIVQDPYPDFKEMRDSHIVPADVRQLLGLEADADLGFDPGDVPPLYTVSSYEAVQEVLR